MDDQKFRNRVEGLEKLAGDTPASQELGKRLVQQVARAVAEEKRGAEISNPQLEMTFQKGQPVPAQFHDRVAVDDAGLALRDSVVQYLNLIIWIRIWVRFWVRIFLPFVLATNPLNRFQDFADRIDLSDDENKLLARLDKLAG
jgi:hypothetical protein